MTCRNTGGFTGARHTVEQTDHRFCRIAFAQNVICHIHLLCRKRLRQPDICHFLLWASEALDFKNLRCALIGKRADDTHTHAGIVAQLAHGYGAMAHSVSNALCCFGVSLPEKSGTAQTMRVVASAALRDAAFSRMTVPFSSSESRSLLFLLCRAFR